MKTSERAHNLYCARVFLRESASRRYQRAFHAVLLRCAANARRRASSVTTLDLFGRRA